MSNTERKLTNKDFRDIVLTARSTRAIEPKPLTITAPEKKAKLKQPYLHKIKERSSKTKTKEEVPETPYRDRAKERREGLIKDGPDEIELALISKETEDVSKISIKETEEDLKSQKEKLAIEEIGQVKGLDYSLLQKTKSEMRKTKKQIQQKTKNAVFEADNLEFKSIMARNIYNIIYGEIKQDQFENFLPGRKVLVYKLDQDHLESFIPVISTRSLLRPTMLDEKTSKIASDALINKLNNIFSYLRGESKKTKTQEIKETIKTKEDIDIYGDEIGEYDPQETLEKYIADKKTKTESYFEKEKISEPPKLDKESLIMDLIESSKELHKKPKPIENKLALKEKLQKLAQEESYVELYQPFDEALETIIDSDEDANFSEKEKKTLINPWDFASQQEYEKYMETKKMVSKGIRQSKNKPNEKRKDKKQSTQKEKNKLDKQWEKINTIMSERKSKAKFDDEEPPTEKRKP